MNVFFLCDLSTLWSYLAYLRSTWKSIMKPSPLRSRSSTRPNTPIYQRSQSRRATVKEEPCAALLACDLVKALSCSRNHHQVSQTLSQMLIGQKRKLHATRRPQLIDLNPHEETEGQDAAHQALSNLVQPENKIRAGQILADSIADLIDVSIGLDNMGPTLRRLQGFANVLAAHLMAHAAERSDDAAIHWAGHVE